MVKRKKRVSLPSLSKKVMPKKGFGKNQSLFKFSNQTFVLEKWGFKDKKSTHFGIQEFVGGTGKGGWLASASCSPLEKSLPGIDKSKAWKLEMNVESQGSQETGRELCRQLLDRVAKQAKEENIKTVVAELRLQKNIPLLESLGFKRIAETRYYAMPI